MKKPVTKHKVCLSLDPGIYDYLNDKFENRSRYIEYLIYKDLKNNGLIKNEIIL